MKTTGVALLFALLFVAELCVGVGANPAYKTIGQADPDSQTYPPTMTFFAPQNKTAVYNSDSLNLSFVANVGQSRTAYKTTIIDVYYIADWVSNKTILVNSYVDEYMLITGDSLSEYVGNVSLSGIPEGEHSITVYALEMGLYERSDGPFWFDYFHMNVSAEIQINKHPGGIEVLGVFVDTEPPPLISNLSLENRVYNVSSIPLNFTVNKVISAVKYSLDGGENITLSGNTALTGLSSGNHVFTIYAIDEARNVETSETVSFAVAVSEPFPIWFLAAVFGFLVVCVCLLVYFLKRKK
jgi:hypothetical protein